MQPLVSIVTPSYNQARFLGHAMQSVLRQDYPRIEYLVVDGASTDGSQEIIRRYADKLAWWVSERDAGQADAINKGFRRASGEIIAWLNSDDLYLPGAVAEAVAVFQQHPEVGVVYGNAVSADGDGRLLNELRFSSWGAADLLQFKIICQPAVFIRRSAAQGVGFLDPSYHFFLDHEFWIRLARENRFLHHPSFWAVSRYHAAAKNVTLAAQSGAEVYRILDWAEGQPDLQGIIQESAPQVWAGAYAIIARYLLDGGKPGEAFLTYARAAGSWLPSLPDYWHRFLFAGLRVLGLGFLGRWYYTLKSRRRPVVAQDRSLVGWPGIVLS